MSEKDFDDDAETPTPEAPEHLPIPARADLDGLIDAQARQGARLAELEREVRELKEEARMPSEAMKKLFFYVSAWVNEAGERWFKKAQPTGRTRPPR